MSYNHITMSGGVPTTEALERYILHGGIMDEEMLAERYKSAARVAGASGVSQKNNLITRYPFIGKLENDSRIVGPVLKTHGDRGVEENEGRKLDVSA
jgi:hypothetical protein